MSRTIAIVELASFAPAGRGAAALAQPSLLADRYLGGQSLLRWLIDRVSQVDSIDDMALLADDELHDVIRLRLGGEFPLLSYGGRDSLARFDEVAQTTGASSVIRIIPGHPFVDPDLVRRLIESARRRSPCDYAGYFVSGGRRSLMSRMGMIVEWLSRGSLAEANRRAVERDDREDASRFVHSHPDLFQVRHLPMKPPYDYRDVRLSLAQPEDWEHAQVLFETLREQGLTWPAIADLVRRNPVIRNRMVQLNRTERV
ncbi:MAG: hypothetical protein U0939_24935 [Pirellulales bacterium]